jgi:2'-5' RNA ligase
MDPTTVQLGLNWIYHKRIMRTFVAVDIPARLRDRIAGQIETFKARALPIKWVAHSNLHITLKFLGEITESTGETVVPLLREIAAHAAPFSVILRNAGCFPGPRRPRVIWIGVERGADELTALARLVETSLTQCGFPREDRFHPHVTIGRVKRPCSVESILKQDMQYASFEVGAIVLYKSTLTPGGAVYESLETFPFKIE